MCKIANLDKRVRISFLSYDWIFEAFIEDTFFE